MTTSFTVSVYQRKLGTTIDLVTLGLGRMTRRRSADGVAKAEERLRDDLRQVVRDARPSELARFDLKRGTRLERVRLEIALKDAGHRKVSGSYPIIVEPRHAGGGRRLEIAYHPLRPEEWFPLPLDAPLAVHAAACFAEAWKALDDGALEGLQTNTKDSLKVLSFNASPRTLLDELPEPKKGVWDDLEIDPARTKQRKKGALQVLPRIGVDLTATREGELADLPRSPYREQLEVLLGPARRQSVLVVGPPGSGKTTLLERLVADLRVAEGYASHRNLDLCTHVWRTHGRQIIAGMSRLGEWEERCVKLLEDVRGHGVILLVPDVHLFGRIGRSRESDRALSDFFRGPVSRGEVVLVGECTEGQLQRLEEDDPAFAASFVRLHVSPASREETFRMMLARARDVEVESPAGAPIEIEPLAYQAILELTDGLFPTHARPGKAVDLLVRLATGPGAAGKRKIGPQDVVLHLSRDTGLPWVLLEPSKPLTAGEVALELEQRVMGQAVAVREAADLVVRVRAGLTDPKRPWGVYLFTGPTGTGKTELARALAEYLYGSPDRLVRFDMSELSGPDAVARLIGDAWSPEGRLTSAAIAQPFSLVLLDEIEKAHPAALNLLLQLFDDARLTDAAGNTASFTQAVVVMTSNLGARQRAPVGFDEAPEALMQDVARAVREFFPPELFNRIDAVVPFRPLTPEVAVDVTRKELSKLFARPGLVDRNVFVEVAPAAIARIARDALRAEDGARSLKRFIEDRIAMLLAEEIAKAPGAALQVLRIREDASGLRVETEPLVEALPVAARYALEPLLARPLVELADRLPDALVEVERIARVAGSLGGSSPHDLERMRAALETLRDKVERLVTSSREIRDHALESAVLQRDVTEHPRTHRKASLKPRPGRMRFDFGRAGTWWELFSCLAETHVLARAASRVASPEQHAVFVELSPLGAGHPFLREMLEAYARARCEVEAIAWSLPGEITEAERGDPSTPLRGAPPDVVVMKLAGLCVLDHLELETGTHVWHSSVREPHLLRVRVAPASPSATAGARLREIVAERAAAGGASVERLLPIVRSIRFDPPPRGRAATPLDMEDYVLGIPYATRVTRLADAFEVLWLVRASRIEEGAP